MEQENDAQHLDGENMSVYPDLDYAPRFPWLGQSSAEHDVRHPDPNPQCDYSIVRHGHVSQDEDPLTSAVPTSFSRDERFGTQPADFEANSFGTGLSGNKNNTSKNPKDISSDPDFNVADGSDMYVFLSATGGPS